MIQVGSVKKERKPSVPWTKWLDEKDHIDGKYMVSAIFPPSGGMSAMVIFETETERVKLRMEGGKWKDVKYELGIEGVGDSQKNKILYVIIENGIVLVDSVEYKDERQECVYRYDHQKTYWRLTFYEPMPI